MKNPVVSICCITYNHAPFIRQCIEGFLMQKPPSNVSSNAKMSEWCEILIHDDCSTDGTTEIIKEYATMYPDLIFPLYEEENQYSKGMAGKMSLFNYKRAKGTYIAYCEGDDYWTEPLKIQRQVDFLEANPDYSVCFHSIIVCDVILNNMWEPPVDIYGVNDDIDVTPILFLESNIGHPLSMVFRRSCYSFEWHKYYTNFFDTIEISHILLTGKGLFMNFIGGQYNLHSGGVSAYMDELIRSRKTVVAYVEMYNYTKEIFLVDKIKKTSLDILEKVRSNKYRNLISILYFLFKELSFSVWIEVCFIYFKRILKNKWLNFLS